MCRVLRCGVLVKDLKEYGAIVFRSFEISKDKETFGQVPRCAPTKALHLFVVLHTKVVLDGNAPIWSCKNQKEKLPKYDLQQLYLKTAKVSVPFLSNNEFPC